MLVIKLLGFKFNMRGVADFLWQTSGRARLTRANWRSPRLRQLLATHVVPRVRWAGDVALRAVPDGAVL